MATRNYTEEAYEQIRHTIEQIDNTDVDPVADFFGDLFLRLAQFLKLYSVEQYRNDMQRWHKTVLDSHNATLSKVDSIFNAVDTVDFQYRDVMDGAHESIVSFRNSLNSLRDIISGKSSLVDGKADAASYISSGKNSLNTSFDTLLTHMETQTYKDAVKELNGDILKLGSGFFTCIRGGNVADYKKFADTLVATFGDLRMVGTVVLLPFAYQLVSFFGADISTEHYLDVRYEELAGNKKMKDTGSVSDLLGGIAEDMEEDLKGCSKDSPFYSVAEIGTEVFQIGAKGAEAADVLVDLYDIGSELKDIHDNIDTWINGKTYTEKEYIEAFEDLKDKKIMDVFEGDDGWIVKVKVSPGEFISKVVSDRTGIPLSGWTDPDKSPGNVFKTAGTLWSYAEKIIPDPVDGRPNDGDVWDVSFSKFKDTKFLKDVFDFARDFDELITQETPDTSSVPQCGDPGSNWFQCEMGVN